VPVEEADGKMFILDLVDDQAAVPKADRNGPFNKWVETLEAWEPRVERVTGQPIEKRRLDHTSIGAFDFLAADNISVERLPLYREHRRRGWFKVSQRTTG
jgi:hypothetical protein